MNNCIKYFLIGVMFLSVFQISASPFSFNPGLSGFGLSISSGSGISSDFSGSSISSGISSSGISSDVSISGTSSLESSQPVSAPKTQKGASGDIIPSHWIIGTREGDYLDPVLNTNWVYDKVLKKYYSPANNLFLVNQYTGDDTLYAQYYYDPKTALFIDMATGKTILPGQSDQTEGTTKPKTTGVPTIQPATKPTTQPVSKPTPKPAVTTQTTTQPIPVSQPETKPTDQPVPEKTQKGNPCEIACSSCPSGVCDDCNGNGKCDDSESSSASAGTKVPTQATTIGPVVNATPQGTAPEIPVHTQTPTIEPTLQGNNTGEPTPTHTSEPKAEKTTEAGGGLIEGGQSTIFYGDYGKDSGILALLACDSPELCTYCLDNNGDGTCTKADCFIIASGTGGDFCVDCDKDGKCDNDKILLMECIKPEKCSEAEYCMDNNNNKRCDRDEEKI